VLVVRRAFFFTHTQTILVVRVMTLGRVLIKFAEWHVRFTPKSGHVPRN
jgi:hypothetical protein